MDTGRCLSLYLQDFKSTTRRQNVLCPLLLRIYISSRPPAFCSKSRPSFKLSRYSKYFGRLVRLSGFIYTSASGHLLFAQNLSPGLSFPNIPHGDSCILFLSGLWVFKSRSYKTYVLFLSGHIYIYISAPSRLLSAQISQILAKVF